MIRSAPSEVGTAPFWSALDDRDEWYRHHHLFAEFLRAELGRRDEGEVAALHARAAAGFEEHRELEEAVRHRLAAGETDRAGSIVCRGSRPSAAGWTCSATSRSAPTRR